MKKYKIELTKTQVEFIHTLGNLSISDAKPILGVINDCKDGYMNDFSEFEIEIFSELYDATLDIVSETGEPYI